MTLDEFHRLDAAAATAELLRCCGSRRWATALAAARPFADRAELDRRVDRLWAEAERADILEALAAHPRIGASADELRARFAKTASWSSGEQAGMGAASEDTIAALAAANAEYFERFGFIFVICATGLGAEEMLAALRARLGNDPERELRVAAAEQAKITHIRLEKLLA